MLNNIIKNRIINLLDSSANFLEGIGVMEKVDIKYSNVYLLRRDLLDSKVMKEVIVVPDDLIQNISDYVSKIKQEDIILKESSIFFVDLFGVDINDPIRIEKNIKILNAKELWNHLFKLSKYFENIETEIGIERLNLKYLNQLAEEIIELNYIGESATREINTNISEYLSNWAKGDNNQNGIFILGERGAGKTWAMKKFVIDQNSLHLENEWINPPAVYVNLKNFGEFLYNNQGIKKSLAYYIFKHYNIRSYSELYFINSAILNGHFILLLDGLDELINTYNTEDVLLQYHTIANYLSASSRVIFSMRSSKLPQYKFLLNHFTRREPKEGLKREKSKQFFLPNITFIKLLPLINNEIKDLLKNNLALLNNQINTESKILNILSSKNFLDTQLKDLAKIPTCAQKIIDYIDTGIGDNLRVFELSLFYPLLVYNIESKRAQTEYFINEEIKRIDLPERISIINHIAWRLIEIGEKEFDPDIIGYSFLEVPIEEFEEILNDIRSQTIFELSETSNRIRFRLCSIQYYFAARYIFSNLIDAKDINLQEGIKLLGRYNLTINDRVNILNFLILFFEKGILKPWIVDEVYFNIEDFKINSKKYTANVANDFKNELMNFAKNPDMTFSPHARFLKTNMIKIARDITTVKNDFIKEFDNQLKTWDNIDIPIMDYQGVLIKNESLSFIISCREVTRNDFKSFLESNYIPKLICKNSDSEFPKLIKFDYRELRDIKSHPLSWSHIHGKIKGGPDNLLLKYFTNDYHLFKWINDEYNPETNDYPVVWISGFIATIYLNWLTLIEQIKNNNIKITSQNDLDNYLDSNNIDFFYNIGLKEIQKPYLTINKNSLGYRLPTKEEWMFAARANDKGFYPWDKYLNNNLPEGIQKEKVKEMGRLLKRYLLEPTTETKSAMSSRCNDFGLFDMIGNVREWADVTDDEKNINLDYVEGSVMGATFALGEESFLFNNKGSKLPFINTNLDVGFRWARSFLISKIY